MNQIQNYEVAKERMREIFEDMVLKNEFTDNKKKFVADKMGISSKEITKKGRKQT